MIPIDDGIRPQRRKTDKRNGSSNRGVMEFALCIEENRSQSPKDEMGSLIARSRLHGVLKYTLLLYPAKAVKSTSGVG